MKNTILDLIQEIVTEEGGIYNTLFGCEETEEHTKIKINWIFNKTELKETVKIVLEHIISQTLQSYNVNKYEQDKDLIGSDKQIFFDNTYKINRFIPINYEVTNSDVKFADIENYLTDIDISDHGHYLYFKWSFPIYRIKKTTLNTF